MSFRHFQSRSDSPESCWIMLKLPLQPSVPGHGTQILSDPQIPRSEFDLLVMDPVSQRLEPRPAECHPAASPRRCAERTLRAASPRVASNALRFPMTFRNHFADVAWRELGGVGWRGECLLQEVDRKFERPWEGTTKTILEHKKVLVGLNIFFERPSGHGDSRRVHPGTSSPRQAAQVVNRAAQDGLFHVSLEKAGRLGRMGAG